VQGSHEVVRQIAPDPEVIPEDPILLRSENDSEHALQLWRSDSALLEQQYLSLQRGVEARYRPKIEKKPEMAASQAAEISVLQRRKTNALLDAGKRRDDRLAQIATDRREALNRIGEANRTAASVVSARTDRFGGGLAWFTLIALGVFVFSIGIEEVHRKGAGITEVVVPGQYDFLPNLFGELQFAIENRLNYRLRAKIREFEALTPLLEELEKEPPKVNKTPEMPVYQQAKPCKQCGKPYLERTTWQLFCSKKCRLSFHETKHGRPYLPHKLYRARQHNMNGKKLALELFEG
jgi:ribosomal protein L37AE/L43A